MADVDVDAVLADLRTKFPSPEFELRAVQLRMGLIVLRNPSHAEHQMYKKQILDDDARAVASENHLMMTAVYPDNASMQRLTKRYPGLVSNVKVQRAMAYLSGQTDESEGKN
jgi:hypothetical protein